MYYRVINTNDSADLQRLWNTYTSDANHLYRTMSIEEIHSKFVHSNHEYDIVTNVAYELKQLIGFCSGVWVKDSDVAYLTFILVDINWQRKGVGTRLLKLTEEMLLRKTSLKRIDIVFFNPINLEWIIPNTLSSDHPNSPGIDIKGKGYPFFKHHEYQAFAIQNAYFRNIETYEYSDRVLEKIEKLNKRHVFINLYNPEIHQGFNELFDDLNSKSWKKIILDNIHQKDEGYPVLVAHRENNICGFAGPLRVQDSMRGYFAGIGISSNCRGLGAGTILFAALCKELRGIGAQYMTLFTGEDNSARLIYESQGFEIVRVWANMRKEF